MREEIYIVCRLVCMVDKGYFLVSFGWDMRKLGMCFLIMRVWCFLVGVWGYMDGCIYMVLGSWGMKDKGVF